MNYKLFLRVLLCPVVSMPAAPGVETVFRPVGLSGQIAPGLSNNIAFSGFNYLSLADDGRIAFTANISGAGVSSTNNLGLWAGLPGDLKLLVRTGDPVSSETNGEMYSFLSTPSIDNYQSVGFLSTITGSGSAIKSAKSDSLARLEIVKTLLEIIEIIKSLGRQLAVNHYNGYVVNTVAAYAQLSGSDIGPTNDIAIVAGPPTNVLVVAQKGGPAPGVSGNFTFFPTSSKTLALMPDGNVAFKATASDPPATRDGIWFGNATNLQAVAVGNLPAPVSLLGPGYTFGGPSSENVEVNARGDLAFAAYLNGPDLNNTNSEFVMAGTPGALHIIARSGQPAPEIPGAFFRPFIGGSAAFSHVLLGVDGAVAFVGCYSETGRDFGLWFAPTNGVKPILLMRNGRQAPGTPAGVVFTNSFPYLPPFESVFMNARNQIVFRALVGGPGGGPNNYGIWLAEPDGTVSLIARTGDMMDVGGGVMRQLSNVTFGIDPEFIAGPEDGRRCPFNDRGEVALVAYFTDFTSGLFVARTGIVLSGERLGANIRIKFPTLNGKHYRVDYRTNLTAGLWSVLEASVAGNGSEVTVTNLGAASIEDRYFRAVRTD